MLTGDALKSMINTNNPKNITKPQKSLSYSRNFIINIKVRKSERNVDADLRKPMLDDETIIKSLKEVSRKHEELLKRLDNLMAGLNKNRKVPDDPF